MTIIFSKAKIAEDKNIVGTVNITISLREKNNFDNFYNLEMLKYRFLCEDNHNIIRIKNLDINKILVKFEGAGKVKHTKKEINHFTNISKLIEKVIFIEKIMDVDINFNLQYFLEKEEFIKLIYNELNNKNYIIKKNMYWTVYMDKSTNVEEFTTDGKISVITFLKDFELFGITFKLKKHKFILVDCDLIATKKNEDNIELQLKTKHSRFELDKQQ